MPLLTDEDPLGVDGFATHRLPLEDAAGAYRAFQEKRDGHVKVLLRPLREPPPIRSGIGSEVLSESANRSGFLPRAPARERPAEVTIRSSESAKA